MLDVTLELCDLVLTLTDQCLFLLHLSAQLLYVAA